MADGTQWRRCNACKQPIRYGALYYVCSVSTCNRKRTALSFCSVSCWEVHLPVANHREAWAEDRTAPSAPGGSGSGGPAESSARGSGPGQTIIRSTPSAKAEPSSSVEILIVASRLKEYVRDRSGFSTSDKVLAPLSEIVRRVSDEAIQNARRDGRRTVLARDVPSQRA